MEQPEDALIDHTVEALARAMQFVEPIRLEVWEELGLTMAQLRILFALQREPALPLREIACRAGVTPSTASGLVEKLVSRRLVRREECSEDRRLVRHFLTPAGRQAAGELRPTTRGYLAGVIGRLEPGELRQLASGLERFCEAASRDPYHAAPAADRAESNLNTY